MSLARATRTVRTRWAIAAMLAVAACDGGPEEAHDDGAHDTQTVSRGLTLGDRGPEVRKVYDYLATYGYFPSAALSERFPGFEPLVAEAPADPDVYDPQLAEGVRKFQQFSGVAPTGVADAETLARMAPRECDYPDGYQAPQHGQGEKFDNYNYRNGATWSIENTPNELFVTSYRDLIQSMINEWSTVHPGTFTRVAAGQGDIRIRFTTVDHRGEDTNNDNLCDKNCTAAWARGIWIDIDNEEPWEFTGTPSSSPSTPFAQRKIDFRSAFLHEFGHALGLGHSDRTTSVMFWQGRRGESLRTLSNDDRTAIRSSRAAKWVQLSAPATILDFSATPMLMVSTEQQPTGGGTVYSYASGSWKKVLGSGATHISGDTRWRPWIRRSDGSIAVRRQDDTAWIEIAGCARDIAVGRGRYAFVVGCDGFVYIGNMDAQADDNTLNSQRASGFTKIPHTGPQLQRLAAYEVTGVAAIDGNGNLWGFAGSSMVQIPIAAPLAMGDIGAASDSIWGAQQSLTGAFALNRQTELRDPREGQPPIIEGKSGWTGNAGQSAQKISVNIVGRPYVVDPIGRLWSTSK